MSLTDGFKKIGGNMWEAIGAATSALIGGASGIMGSNKSTKAAKHNLESQMNWNKYVMENAHQVEMQDLEKAGVNPILYMGNGAANAGVTPQMPDYSGISASGTNIMAGLNSAFTIMDQVNQMQNRDKLTEADSFSKTISGLKELEQTGILKKYGGQEAEATIKKLLAEAENQSKQGKLDSVRAELEGGLLQFLKIIASKIKNPEGNDEMNQYYKQLYQNDDVGKWFDKQFDNDIDASTIDKKIRK
ncbi:DNA pilot protein [Dipodfec virus UA23Rod_1071]|uniref:DNA pilot protein n=1 Tax=Dipodfec virus UA23Rod_1071 TaxID=2929326 RepID=A0A976N251_9VIRU|nr:DNA pilot protein [Dipodfec virus UA23Rod_1071]